MTASAATDGILATTNHDVEGQRLLVVDDESAVRQALQRALSLEGYEVDVAANGDHALSALARDTYDAVLMDVQMPGMTGLEVCERMRGSGDLTPIIVVTARAKVSDRVAGLDAGADDYLVKPFALDELLARLRALVRRRGNADSLGLLRFSDLALDPATLRVERAGDRIDLSRTEYALLQLFMRNPEKILSRTFIFESVWGYDFGDTSNCHEIYVGYLRRKTEAGGKSRLIHTIRGEGYVLRES